MKTLLPLALLLLPITSIAADKPNIVIILADVIWATATCNATIPSGARSARQTWTA